MSNNTNNDWVQWMTNMATLADRLPPSDSKQDLLNRIAQVILGIENRQVADTVDQTEALQTELIRLLLSEGKNE